MTLELVTTESKGRFDYTECNRLSKLADCHLPEKEFTQSEFEFIQEKYGILGPDIISEYFEVSVEDTESLRRMIVNENIFTKAAILEAHI